MNDVPFYLSTQNFFSDSTSFFIDLTGIPKRFPMHRHDFIEIEFFISGEGVQVINGVEYQIKKGSFVLLMPWHAHEVTPLGDQPLKLYKCSFQAETFIGINQPFFELRDIFNDFTLPPCVDLQDADFERVFALFNEILQEDINMNLWMDTLIKSKITEVLVYFDRCRKSVLRLNKEDPDEPDQFNIWKAVKYVHAMFNKDLTLGDVADNFHYSENYLNRLFREKIGLNFEELLQEVRVRNACAFMSNSTITITEASTYVGFKSKEAFYRAFKNVKGISPGKFRKYILDKNNGEKVFTISVLNSQIIYYLHLHYSENLTLHTVAQHFHYTDTYLCDVLMQYGLTFTHLLHEIRIYHACSLLLTTDIPVNEIGFSVGFDSTETFFRVFKKFREVSPGEFRKKSSE